MRKIYGTKAYIAPEVFQHNYNSKCDIWSIGVMAYIFLCGEQPFGRKGTTEKEIEEIILKGNPLFDQKVWVSISKEAKDFV